MSACVLTSPAGASAPVTPIAVTPEAPSAARRMRKYRAKGALLRAIKRAASLGVDVADVFECYTMERSIRQAGRS